MMVGEDASAAGAFPEPWVDPAAFMYEEAGFTRTAVLNDPASMVRLQIDVRVRRRILQEHFGLWFIIQNLVGSGGAMDQSFNLKALVRTP